MGELVGGGSDTAAILIELQQRLLLRHKDKQTCKRSINLIDI